jgi:hypothetical protein
LALSLSPPLSLAPPPLTTVLAGRDFAELCADSLASNLGFGAKDGMPTRSLAPNACAVCGTELYPDIREVPDRGKPASCVRACVRARVCLCVCACVCACALRPDPWAAQSKRSA